MKILQIIHSADPLGGGPIEGVKQQSFALTEFDCESEVLSLDDPAAPFVAGFPLKLHAMGPSASGYGYTARLIPWLKKHHGDYDVVIINGLWQFSGLGAWSVLRRTTTPYCVFTHGMLDPWFKRRYPFKHLKKWLYWPWAEYRVLRDAAAVLFTCEEERVQARRSFWLYRCREVVVNFGIAAPGGDPVAQRALFLARFPELKDKRLLLFLGRIHEKKGCDLLLEAFSKLQARLPLVAEEFRLVMAGPRDSQFAEDLQGRAQRLGIASGVYWTGMLSGDLKWGAFHAAELFILPSHQENFGISVAESLACGVPVIISDKVNIWREIDQAQAGLICRDTAPSTEQSLESWVALDSGGRHRLQSNARSCFQEHFESRKAATSLLTLFQKLLESK